MKNTNPDCGWRTIKLFDFKYTYLRQANQVNFIEDEKYAKKGMQMQLKRTIACAFCMKISNISKAIVPVSVWWNSINLCMEIAI